MQLKKYQNDTLAVIKAFFDALDTKTPGEAYESVTSSADMIARLGNLRHYEPLGGSRRPRRSDGRPPTRSRRRGIRTGRR